MLCDNQFCFYWSDNLCTLSDISLDDRGCCQDCLTLSLTDRQLQKAREKTLRLLDRQYDHWE